ncbi:hypothetical protein DM01DRAFT_1347337 [Hesseltinella vesiculosa]|uniref:Methyltransferase FkbM domain-containing protein n=1 Tax=Hesseltinella vesiculosa TaxID=101127 RepID=A0A1X2GDC1_9FUNG|nr:hypothetical protein DM01DRAFT_1347337 [Hesseltinella vesiculosa]
MPVVYDNEYNIELIDEIEAEKEYELDLETEQFEKQSHGTVVDEGVTSDLEALSEENPEDLHKALRAAPKRYKNFDLLSPISDKSSLRYDARRKNVFLADDTTYWQVGVVNSKPNVFLTSADNFEAVKQVAYDEAGPLMLMKWILRIHRNDTERTTPLTMVDVGAGDGLYSMVAGASGAHVLAIEPLMHRRSMLSMSTKLNRMNERVRILPFAVFDEYVELDIIESTMVHADDGGPNNAVPALTNSWTIRLDSLPKYEMLYRPNMPDQIQVEVPMLDPLYANALKKAMGGKLRKVRPRNMIPDDLTFRQPIHFLRIDANGLELEVLDSCTKLFEKGLVESAMVEWGPVQKWDMMRMTKLHDKKARERSLKAARVLLRKMINRYNFKAYIVSNKGFESAYGFMRAHYNHIDKPFEYTLAKAYQLDDNYMMDEYYVQLKTTNQTTLMSLEADTITAFVDAMDYAIDSVTLLFIRNTTLTENILNAKEVP